MNTVTLALMAEKWFGFEFDRLHDERLLERGLDLIALTKTVNFGEAVSGSFGERQSSIFRTQSCLVYLEEIRPGVAMVYVDGTREQKDRYVFDSTKGPSELEFVDFMVTALRGLKLENFVLNLSWEPMVPMGSVGQD